MTHPVNPNLSESQPDSLEKEPRPAAARVRQNELPAVGGRIIDCTLAMFERRCLIALRDEQEKLLPDNRLVALYCDAVRLSREYTDGVAIGLTRRFLSEQSVGSPADGVAAEKLEKIQAELRKAYDLVAGTEFDNVASIISLQRGDLDDLFDSFALPKPETEQRLAKSLSEIQTLIHAMKPGRWTPEICQIKNVIEDVFETLSEEKAARPVLDEEKKKDL